MQQQQHHEEHNGQRLQALRAFVPAAVSFDKPLHTRGIRRPAVNVGEYLPEMEAGETEIARISLASTTGDVVSIRARKSKRLVVISVHDEYETVFTDFNDKYNGLPTQGELFDLLCSFRGEADDLPYLPGVIEYNGYETADDALDFITLDSQLYPDLETLFRAWIDEPQHVKTPEELFREMVGDSIPEPPEELVAMLANQVQERKNGGPRTEWDILVGTLCFNIWHRTKHEYLETGDNRQLALPFIVALNLFQQWDRLELSRIYDRAVVTRDASEFIQVQKKVLLENLPVMLRDMETLYCAQGYALSHALAMSFNMVFAQIYNGLMGKSNPLDFIQAGIEVLFLLAPDLERKYPEWNQRLLDIRHYDVIVEDIIEFLNALEAKPRDI